ncbi:MAG: hypothetical protein R6U96_00695 [Promethearchaeia archaeon]
MKLNDEQKSIGIRYIPYIKNFYIYQAEQINPAPFEMELNNICSINIGIKRYLSANIKKEQDFNLKYIRLQKKKELIIHYHPT